MMPPASGMHGKLLDPRSESHIYKKGDIAKPHDPGGVKKREAQCVAPLSLALATIVDENSIIETSKQSVLKKPNNSVIRRESYVNLVR